MKNTYVKIITIALFFSGQCLFAQEADKYAQDTLWLKSGEVIPCRIVSATDQSDTIYVKYINEDGKLVFNQYPKNIVDRIKMGPIFTPVPYKIELKDGTRLTGTILSETETEVTLELQDLGELTISRDRIEKMIPLNASLQIKKSYWFPNPNATRLLFAPTAIPLRKGEGYYQNIYIVANMFNYGVANNFSIGGGFDFITMFARVNDGEWNPVLNFNTKVGVKVHDYVHVGVGGLYVTQLNNFSAGIPYALSTFGSYNSNFTTGIGWGFVDGTFEKKPFIMFGGMARCSEKIWFVSENWLTPLDGEKYYLLVSYGLRFSGRKMSVDLAFINSKDIIETLLIGIPYVDFVIKFGK